MAIVNTIGTGGDYSTVQAWEDAIPSTLADSYTGQVKNEELTSTGLILDMSAHVTTASFFIVLEAVAGGAFNDNANVRTNALRYNSANGAALKSTSGNSQVISVSGVCDYFTVRNLQLASTGGGSYSKVVGANVSAGGTNNRWKNLILDCNGAGRAVASDFAGGTWTNCLFIMRGSSTGEAGFDNYYVIGNIINCTIVLPSNLSGTGFTGISPSYSGTNIKNCAILGFQTNQLTRAGWFGAVADYNGTDLSSGASTLHKESPDHNVYSVANSTATFVQSSDSGGSQDYRLASGSALIAVGSYDGTNAPNDISGTARANPPCIGCWEFISATITIAKISNLMLLGIG